MAKAYVETGSWIQKNESLPLAAAPAQPQPPPRRPNRVARVLTKLLVRFKPEVPVGYENETGFHYGAEPPRDRPSI
jgi:hypothetical protein